MATRSGISESPSNTAPFTGPQAACTSAGLVLSSCTTHFGKPLPLLQVRPEIQILFLCVIAAFANLTER